MKPDTILVTTTINVPTFLKDVCENAKTYRREGISIIVIGDVKTPKSAAEFCHSLSLETGIKIDFYDIEAQRLALKNYPVLFELMPLNSGSRKMIGNFLAHLRGCEQLIMLDDDNFVQNSDFFGLYEIVGQNTEIDIIKSDSGWFNIYEALVEKESIPFYPRGFPWSERGSRISNVTKKRELKDVVLLNGFVLNDPDIDAISRLFWPIRVTGTNSSYPSQFALHPNTWTSFNNQNTAISRELIPIYFTPPSTGRNSDIWTAYIVCRIVSHMNSVVAFGAPLVEQVRNPHDLWDDLDAEVVNNRATEKFVELLRSAVLNSETYLGALEELLMICLNKIVQDEYAGGAGKEMIINFFKEYLTWVSLMREVNNFSLPSKK